MVTKSPLIRVALLAAQSYSITIIGLFIGILSARGLSVSDRGTLAIILLITQLCSRVGSLGFEQVIYREGVKEHPQNYYIAGIIGSFLCLPIAIVATWVSSIPVTLALIIVPTAGFISVLRVNSAWLIYLDKLRILFLFNLGQSIVQFSLYAVIFKTGSLSAFYVAWVINVVIFSIVSVYILRNFIDTHYTRNFKMRNLLSTWQKGFRYIGIAIPEMALTFCLELPIVRYLLGGSSAGLYSISNTLNGIYYQLFASISSIFAKNTLLKFPRLKIYGTLFVLLILGILASRPLIVVLFGKPYSGAAEIFVIMVLSTFLLGIARIEYVLMEKQPRLGIQVKLSGLLILALLMGVFIDQNYIFYYVSLAYSAYAVISMVINVMGDRKNVEL
jgi:O-antigen/teichoic acid export membrane protein